MDYHTPKSFEDAASIAADANGTYRFLAGGTDVLVQMRAGMFTPDTLIDVKHIPGAKDITRDSDGGWTIGVAVAGAELSEHGEIGKEWPGLVEAMDLVGSTQVQGRATLVGNLCHGSPAADSVPAMVAAGVELSVLGANGTRRVKVEDVPTGPGKTSIGAGEIVTGVHVPARGAQGGDAYLRFIPRTEMDIAVVGCGVNLQVDGDKITQARVSLGAVAPTVLLLEDAGADLVGTTLDEAALDALAASASAACKPINDKRGTIEFRVQVAGVLAKRAAKIAYDRARG